LSKRCPLAPWISLNIFSFLSYFFKTLSKECCLQISTLDSWRFVTFFHYRLVQNQNARIADVLNTFPRYTSGTSSSSSSSYTQGCCIAAACMCALVRASAGGVVVR
jgi:hypothetical protein